MRIITLLSLLYSSSLLADYFIHPHDYSDEFYRCVRGIKNHGRSKKNSLIRIKGDPGVSHCISAIDRKQQLLFKKCHRNPIEAYKRTPQYWNRPIPECQGFF